ncbi:hypothetical protein PBAL39_23027 [Pedobacter sp. BAL39]|uniref:glycosyltransferase n=1 Tax=Pedobacter sp. BAL39 TaxID=391596 RepID=UPI0001559D20|nr:glycosyltransferase [Pedobacter sp. BAL39]EDM35931.1 hypothetical protein PBAL39_23027 [Pedobacter sp. BAL39]
MNFKIAFYIHHHGLGHLTRAMEIMKRFPDHEMIFMGSNLHFQSALPANVRVVHLPLDVANETDTYYHEELPSDIFHYAPLNVSGIRDRMSIMTELFRDEFPMILIVDVSVEVALLARLCGIPTIVMRQHGKRGDLPHRLAYQSAELLIAPYPRSMYRGNEDEAYAKTLFTGGFSKFNVNGNPAKEIPNHIAILLGGGGSSLNSSVITEIATTCPNHFFHILGKISGDAPDLTNTTWYGHLDQPQSIIEQCTMVIGNTGHNTVMEVASLNKRFIGIPEQRPFEEQLDKAEAISSRRGIHILLPEHLPETNWNNLLETLQTQQLDWTDVIAEDALAILEEAVLKTGNSVFNMQP